MSSTVKRRATDSSGRGIYATDYMWKWWTTNILGDPRVASFRSRITITQGAFMKLAGGGAADSAGYHDGGGTFDLRVWNLTASEILVLVSVLRQNGAAAYHRDVAHGGFTDPHIHFVLGSDSDLSAGAKFQWSEYLAGRDGLASRGKDYHARPTPLVTVPPVIVSKVAQARAKLRQAKALLKEAGKSRPAAKKAADRTTKTLQQLPKK